VLIATAKIGTAKIATASASQNPWGNQKQQKGFSSGSEVRACDTSPLPKTQPPPRQSFSYAVRRHQIFQPFPDHVAPRARAAIVCPIVCVRALIGQLHSSFEGVNPRPSSLLSDVMTLATTVLFRLRSNNLLSWRRCGLIAQAWNKPGGEES
jgi:hypothetical protein